MHTITIVGTVTVANLPLGDLRLHLFPRKMRGAGPSIKLSNSIHDVHFFSPDHLIVVNEANEFVHIREPRCIAVLTFTKAETKQQAA